LTDANAESQRVARLVLRRVVRPTLARSIAASKWRFAMTKSLITMAVAAAVATGAAIYRPRRKRGGIATSLSLPLSAAWRQGL